MSPKPRLWAPGPGVDPFRFEEEGPDKPTGEEVAAAQEALATTPSQLYNRRRLSAVNAFAENFEADIPDIPTLISNLPPHRQRQLDLAAGDSRIRAKLIRLWVKATPAKVNQRIILRPIGPRPPAEEGGAGPGAPTPVPPAVAEPTARIARGETTAGREAAAGEEEEVAIIGERPAPSIPTTRDGLFAELQRYAAAHPLSGGAAPPPTVSQSPAEKDLAANLFSPDGFAESYDGRPILINANCDLSRGDALDQQQATWLQDQGVRVPHNYANGDGGGDSGGRDNYTYRMCEAGTWYHLTRTLQRAPTPQQFNTSTEYEAAARRNLAVTAWAANDRIVWYNTPEPGRHPRHERVPVGAHNVHHRQRRTQHRSLT